MRLRIFSHRRDARRCLANARFSGLTAVKVDDFIVNGNRVYVLWLTRNQAELDSAFDDIRLEQAEQAEKKEGKSGRVQRRQRFFVGYRGKLGYEAARHCHCPVFYESR